VETATGFTERLSPLAFCLTLQRIKALGFRHGTLVCDYPKVRLNSTSETSVKPITQESRSPMPGRVSDERQRQEVAEWKAITLPADAYAER
jgi:hypothetical protein